MSVIHAPQAPPLGLRQSIAPAALGVCLSLFLFRLWDLQVARAHEFRELAEGSHTVEDLSQAARGMVVDRNGLPLATVWPTYVLFVRPEEVRKQENRGLLEKIADRSGVRLTKIARALAAAKPEGAAPVALAKLTPSQKTKMSRKAKPLPGVSVSSIEGEPTLFFDPVEATRPMNRGLIEKLADRLGLRPADLFEQYERNLLEHGVQTPIATDLTELQAILVAEAGAAYPGVSVEVRQMRHYSDPQSLSHLLGYVGAISDQKVIEQMREKGEEYAGFVGLSGVERSYEAELAGKSGKVVYATDARRRPVRYLRSDEPVPGDKVTLTIDLELQRLAGRLLAGSSGSLVALDIKNGDVLALASSPGFDLRAKWGGDNDEWARAQAEINELEPLSPEVNRPIKSWKAPGSSFKVVTTLAAALSGNFHPEAMVTCPGYYQMSGGSRLKCENHTPFQTLNFHSAMAASCNSYFAGMARSLTKEQLFGAYEQLGLSKPTGIDLPGEWRGLRLTDKSFGHDPPRVTEGDRSQLGIGQGLCAMTPLQMALVAALIGNAGWEPVPRVVRSVTRYTDGKERPQPVNGRLSVSLPPVVWQKLTSAMKAVIQEGTARSAILDFDWAGKTGSAEESKSKPTHSWFIGFGPLPNPQVAICVMVEHGGHGGTKAAPMAAQWMERWMAKRSQSAESSDNPRVEIASASEFPAD